MTCTPLRSLVGVAGAALWSSLALPLSLAVPSSLVAQPAEGTAGDSVAVPSYDTPKFQEWLDALRRDARAQGISETTLDAALSGLEPIRRVIELDQSQPEFTLTFEEYLTRVARADRVTEGQKLLADHRETLDAVSERYGVQPRVIVALWGIETNFGSTLGSFRVVPSLVTLSYEGRRGTYFRQELLHALRIIDEGHVSADGMMGSWAGAMGQCQFMPSSFVNNAVDFDGDGRRDIWGTHADVFASAANYLRNSGWNDDFIWGREVTLPSGFDTGLATLEQQKPISAWRALGVTRADGIDLPRSPDLDGSIVMPGGADGPAYLVYDNYRAIMKWNRSTYFATTVGILSDRIGGR
jgi:membrane-bound lytic murein transglycosylase B